MRKADKKRGRKKPERPKETRAAGIRQRPAPNAPDLDVEAGGLVFRHPDGRVERLPPLVDECIQLHLRGYRRRDVQAHCLQRYNCSRVTIDRAWATAKAEVWASVESDKMKRIKETASRLDHLYRLSLEAGDRTNARLSVKERARTLGDDRPDPLGGLMDTGTLEELLKQVKEQEAMLAQAVKEAGVPGAAAIPAEGGK
jgi:hypothetical protein